MKKKFFLSCLLIVMALLPAVAQIQDPVQFKTELKTISDTEAHDRLIALEKFLIIWICLAICILSTLQMHIFPYRTKRIQKALVSGHLVLVPDKNKTAKYTAEDIDKLDKKLASGAAERK